MKNLATILNLKSKLSEKFQRWNEIQKKLKCQKTVEFPKISIKMENFKKFSRPRQRASFKQYIQLPTR